MASSLTNIAELENRLHFQYLAHNGFETLEERRKVEAKGMEKWAKGEVSLEEINLGKQFAYEIRKARIPPVSVRWISDRIGYGLFAQEEIVEGAFVGEYTGIVRENNRIYFEPLNHYCYEYPILDSIGRSFVIDATSGNLTRFINHSSKPNIQPVYAFLNGFYHCIFLAIQRIGKDSQLSYDYGKSYWYIREPPEGI